MVHTTKLILNLTIHESILSLSHRAQPRSDSEAYRLVIHTMCPFVSLFFFSICHTKEWSVYLWSCGRWKLIKSPLKETNVKEQKKNVMSHVSRSSLCCSSCSVLFSVRQGVGCLFFVCVLVSGVKERVDVDLGRCGFAVPLPLRFPLSLSLYVGFGLTVREHVSGIFTHHLYPQITSPAMTEGTKRWTQGRITIAGRYQSPVYVQLKLVSTHTWSVSIH